MISTPTPPRPERTVDLRPVQLADWPTIHEWARRPDVTQYQAWGPNRAVETREYVVAAIEAVAAGRSVIDPKIVELLVAAKARVEQSPLAQLTPRELEVLLLVAEGRTNREIGATLFMSEKTASVHVSRILAKLDVRSRTEAAAVAHRLGLA